MKFFTAFTVALTSASASAFVGPQHQRNNRIAPLEASSKNQGWALVTGAVFGLTLATQVATASVTTNTLQDTNTNNYPTTMISLGAYQPEEGYAKLDMSFPTYKVEDISSPKEVQLEDPVKEAARVAKQQATADKAAEKEQANAKAYFEKQKATTAKKAEKEAIQAQVAAGRQAAKEAKFAGK